MKKKYIKITAIATTIILSLMVFFYQVYQRKTQTEEIWGIADAKEISINSKVSGRILKICVEEGQKVEKGDILAYLDKDAQTVERTQIQAALAAQMSQLIQTSISAKNDTAVLTANLRAAEANLQSAYANLELASNDAKRYQELLARSAVSKQTCEAYQIKYKTAQATYDSAKEALNSARADLLKNDLNQEMENMRQKQIEEIQGKLDNVKLMEDEAEIRAPYSGIITKKYVEEGSLVSTTVPLFSLQDPLDNWVNFKINETDINEYHLNDTVKLTARNSKLQLEGKIISISRKPDYATIKATNERGDKDITAFNVKVQTNADSVWPGMRFMLNK